MIRTSLYCRRPLFRFRICLCERSPHNLHSPVKSSSDDPAESFLFRCFFLFSGFPGRCLLRGCFQRYLFSVRHLLDRGRGIFARNSNLRNTPCYYLPIRAKASRYLLSKVSSVMSRVR